MPKRAIALGLGLLAFLGIVLAIAAWAAFGDTAGTQRGLVLTNMMLVEGVVTLENGQSARIEPTRQQTFVIRREEFPSTITVTSADGDRLIEREFAYDYFARADFRVSFDENGFFPTTAVRATPVRTPPQEETP